MRPYVKSQKNDAIDAEAVAAGARFLVSPGCTTALVDASLAVQVPLVLGIATVSEALVLAEQGFDVLKFFPAQAAGGGRH